MPLDTMHVPDTQAEDAMRSVETALAAVDTHTRAVRTALHRVNCWLGAQPMTAGELSDLTDAALALGRAETAAEDAAAHMQALMRWRSKP